jgi:hypothetical protein
MSTDALGSFESFLEADRQKEARQIADGKTGKYPAVAAIANPEERLALARAIVDVRAMYPEDFDWFYSGMEAVLAPALRPDWSLMKPVEYVESLYIILKHATFAAAARAMIFDSSGRPN